MSPTNPLGLRIASKKWNAPFIGASQYYFYNQLKQNILISKSTQQLSKQLTMPISQIANNVNSHFEQKNLRLCEIAYPRALPISILLKAKQLFDSQYALGRNRLLSITVSYAAQFQQQFDARVYNYFTNHVSSAFFFNHFKEKNKTVKQQTKKRKFPIFLFFSTKQKQIYTLQEMGAKKKEIAQQLKKKCGGNSCITKKINPSLALSSLITKRRLMKQKQIPRLYGTVESRQKIPFVGAKQKSICTNWLLVRNEQTFTTSLIVCAVCIFIHNFLNFKNVCKSRPIKCVLFVNKKSIINASLPPFLIKAFDTNRSHHNFLGNFKFKNSQKSSGIVLAFLSQLSPMNRALYQYSMFTQYESLSFLLAYPRPIGAACLAKEVFQKQRPVYTTPRALYQQIKTNIHSHLTSYTILPYSNSTTLNLKNTTSKKSIKQLENIRSHSMLLGPLKILIHRSFLESVGIHYLSSLNNRVAKMYSNKFLKNSLLTRLSKDYLRANYIGSRQGLIRLKDTILFDFAYTKSALIQFDLKKTELLTQQVLDTSHRKVWLRKTASIRV